MAGSIEEYKKKYYTDTQESHNKSLKVLEDTKARDDKLAKETYDLNEKDINNYYGTRITDAEDSYETALKQNEVQKILNERAVERRMAEMGLTDSGLNRTQSTAVQLSYANHKGELTEQRQKAIDTLAAAMTSDLAKNKLTYNTTLATNQNTYDTSVATLNTNRDNDAHTYGVSAHNADVEAEEKAIKAQYTAQNNLIEKLYDDDISNEAKQAYVNNYVLTHDIPDDLRRPLKNMGYTMPDEIEADRKRRALKIVEDGISSERGAREFLRQYGIRPNEPLLSKLDWSEGKIKGFDSYEEYINVYCAWAVNNYL